jgi:hypothetical protein
VLGKLVGGLATSVAVRDEPITTGDAGEAHPRVIPSVNSQVPRILRIERTLSNALGGRGSGHRNKHRGTTTAKRQPARFPQEHHSFLKAGPKSSL